MLLIYTQQVTNRVKYTFNLIFGDVLGVDHTLTTDPDHFRNFEGPKVSYATQPFGDEIFFKSEELLFRTGTGPFTPVWCEHPKDIFELAFFLVTRYEEYQPFLPDRYGRFSAKQSYAHKNNCLDKPVVNIWAQQIRETIKVRYPDLTFPEKKYLYTPTIDIDNAYAYLGKSLTRTLGGYMRSLLKSDMTDLSKRKKVLAGKEKDPYDTYDFQIGMHEKYHLKPIYFFLLGDWASNDKNLPHTNPLMQELIKKISDKAETGIHPSFASNNHPEKVEVEKKRLEQIVPSPELRSQPTVASRGGQTAVTKSRQHFLKLRFPDTYRNLIASGITDDYTMGYADEIGFRAGICTPFKWYDLEKEEETNLTIHPFAVMDGTLNNYLRLTPEKAIEKVKGIAKEIKSVNGEFITIWHNETLSDWREWKGWKEMYEKIIEIAQAPSDSPVRGEPNAGTKTV